MARKDEKLWCAVDRYLRDLFIPRDAALDGALKASDAAGLPPIHVSPPHGKLLHLLARLCGARNILEIGTLAGYSTIWLARALPPEGRLVTLELNPRHAAIAAKNLARAKLADKVEIRLGKALDTLPQLVKEKRGPFDLIFLDADKESYVEYLQWALRLSRKGSVIVADNVVRAGEVLDPKSKDPMALGARRFNAALAAEKRLSATVIQTVGGKGYDGFALAVVTS